MISMYEMNPASVARWMNRVRQLGIPTDGDSVMLGDTLVTICPWWDGPNMRRAVKAQIERDATKPRKSWLWVYHAPPSGSPTCWDGRQFYGDAELATWIEKYRPDMVFAGHIHQAPFTERGSWADGSDDMGIRTVANRLDRRLRTSSSTPRLARPLVFAGGRSRLAHLDLPLQPPLPELMDRRPGSSLNARVAVRPRVKRLPLIMLSVSRTSSTIERWLSWCSNCRLRSTR